jgi:hypothetical protein
MNCPLPVNCRSNLVSSSSLMPRSARESTARRRSFSSNSWTKVSVALIIWIIGGLAKVQSAMPRNVPTETIGARQFPKITDSLDQSIAAGATVAVTISFYQIATASGVTSPLVEPAANEALVFESVGMSLTCEDASGKLQILYPAYYAHGLNPINITAPVSFPWTFPATSGRQLSVSPSIPLPPITQISGVTATGLPEPVLVLVVTNTDKANSHTYKRSIDGVVRRISNISADGLELY